MRLDGGEPGAQLSGSRNRLGNAAMWGVLGWFAGGATTAAIFTLADRRRRAAKARNAEFARATERAKLDADERVAREDAEYWARLHAETRNGLRESRGALASLR